MFYKKDVLTNFAKFTGNTCARVSILIKLQASGSASTKMFLIWTKNICKFFRRFVCWKTRRKQVAIHKKSNYILQVFVLLFSFRPSFRKIRLISKFMTSNSGKQITAIHIIAQYLNKETQSDNEIRSVNRI